MPNSTSPGRGNIENLWPNTTIRKLNGFTANLLLHSLTLSSPSDYLRWSPPDNIPNPSFNFLVGPPSIGRISRLLGLNEGRRYVLLRLFDLAYSFRLRLPLLISAGFCFVSYCLNYRVELIIEEEGEDDGDVEAEVEDSDDD